MIYDWLKIPDEVKWVATDADGWAWQYLSEPKRYDVVGEWRGELPSRDIKAHIKPHQNPFRGDWRESLEQRPQHPCSGKCPRFEKEQCKSCLVGDE